MKTAIRALGHRNFRLFFSGQIVSLVGTWMQRIALSWLVYRLTGSAFLLGAVGFAGQIPTFLLAPVAGVFADRSDRRKILMVTQSLAMVQALILSALVLTGMLQIWHIFVLSIFLGLVNAWDTPVRQAFMVEMVEKKEGLLGFLMGASGIGALGGAVYLASRKSVLGLGRIIPMATGLFGMGLIAFSRSRLVPLSMLLMLATGFGMIVEMAASNTVLQTIVDDDKRGRIMSFFTMAFMGMTPFGSLLAGVLASSIGAQTTVLLGGAGCLVGAALFAVKLPTLRSLVRPIYVQKGIIPEIAIGIQSAAELTMPDKKSV